MQGCPATAPKLSPEEAPASARWPGGGPEPQTPGRARSPRPQSPRVFGAHQGGDPRPGRLACLLAWGRKSGRGTLWRQGTEWGQNLRSVSRRRGPRDEEGGADGSLSPSMFSAAETKEWVPCRSGPHSLRAGTTESRIWESRRHPGGGVAQCPPTGCRAACEIVTPGNRVQVGLPAAQAALP